MKNYIYESDDKKILGSLQEEKEMPPGNIKYLREFYGDEFIDDLMEQN